MVRHASLRPKENAMTDEHKEAMIDKIAQATAAQFWKEQESGRYPNLGLMIRDALIGYESRITEENTNMAQKPVGIVTVGPHDHGPFTFRETAYGADHLPTGDTPVYAAASAKAQWQPIETAPKGRKVLVAYQNQLGNWRRVIAKYYLPETLDSEHNESGYADEGWYEESETHHEEIMRTDCEPTLWQPLPPIPLAAAASEQRGGSDE